MDTEPRFIFGYNYKNLSKVVENPRWMTETRARKLFKPLAKLVNSFQYEPLRDAYYPGGDPFAGSNSFGEAYHADDGGMVGVLARVELNNQDGKELADGIPKDFLAPINT